MHKGIEEVEDIGVAGREERGERLRDCLRVGKGRGLDVVRDGVDR